ncbi:MAG: hypothetical protein VX278_07225, partial [Myxococcota bacterium]|nr:hypothetical protein [Myxococcota bacterium]
MSKADKKIYGLVKQSIKLLKSEPGLRLSFCFIEQKGSPALRIFYIDKKKGTKPVKFATVKKISAFLTTLGSESFGTRARSCAGTVSCQDDTFVFTVTHKVGISPALLEKSVKKLNTMFKLGIGSMSLAGGESEPKPPSSGKRYAWYEKELNRIYETQKGEYPPPSTVLGALTIPPTSILDSMLGLIEEYEEKDPVDAEDKQNPAKIDTALDWLYAYLDESNTQKEAQETMGVDAATFASLLPFYRYANNNAKRIIAPLFAEEVDNLVQKAEELRNILPPNLRGHASAAAIPSATIDSPQGALFVDEQVPVQCDLFLRSYTLERVLQLEAYSPFDQHLRQSKELRIELRRLLNESILLPYQSILQELMQAEGSKAVSQAEELHQELNGAAKADRVNKALFTVLKAKESQKKKVRTVELVRRNDNKLNEFNTLSRHLEGSPLETDVNALITDLQKGASDQYPGVEVHIGSFVSLEAIVSNRFGGLNEFSVAYLTELMRTGRINNVWSLINSLGLVANSHIQVPLALDLLNKMSADEKREALNKPKVRERIESLIKPDFFGSKNNYAAIFKEHLAFAQSDEDSGSEEDKATGHRIAVQFYCMVRDGYENLSKAIALLQNWMEKSKIEAVKSLQDEFRGKFKELAGLSRVRSKFSSKDAQHCNNIIQSYIDQYERLNESKVQTDKIPPEDIKAIADLDALLETGSVEKLNHAIQNLRADQKERYLTSLLEDEFDRLDLQNPSLNEELKQKVYDKALGQLRERMKKKGCKEADIRNMESAFLFDAKEESLHATIRRKVDTLSLQNILDKIHSVSAKDIDQLKTSIQSIIHDFKLLKSLWDKGEGAQRDELFKILGVTYSQDSKGFISHTESKRFETAKGQFQLLQPDNLEATRNVLSAEWNTLPPEEQEVYGNQRKFVDSKLHALEELTIDGEKIDGMSAASIKQHIDILKKEQEETPQEDVQQKISLLETACASVEAKKLAPPIPVKDNTAYENEKILGENASFTEDPNFWGAQINKTLNVMLRTDADLSSAAQMVYKAQDSMITTWYKMSDAEQSQYPDKETFVKQKMYGIWTQLSSDVQQWLKSESMTSRMGGNKEIKSQICHALESYSESNTLQSETMLMQKGDTVNASLTDIENAFDVISTFELLEKYSNYRMLQPKTDEMSLLSQQKFSKESQALDIKREYDTLLAKEATWEQSPPEQPKERESVAQQKEEKKNRYDLLRQEVEDIETQQKEVRDGIDGFTLDVRPDQIEKLWNSGGWGRSNLRKIELLNLVRSKIAHHATTEEGRAFLKEKLPGYAIDALSSNKLLVLSDLTKQKSKDTGVQWDLFSNASSMRKEGAS